MKFNEENMQAETESYMENPFWREMYENAPETAKKRLRVAFWASRHLDEKEDLDQYREYREQVEREMTYEDAAYLAEHFPEGAGKKHYTEMRDMLEIRPLKTHERLDEAAEILLEGCSDEDREMYEKTRAALKVCDEPWVQYEWLWEAVGGNGDSAEWLGDTFDHGHGVPADEDLAFYWFRKAAMSGHADSCCRLAAIYEREDSRHFDMSRALFWYREALRRNSLDAKIDLGSRLTTREGEVWEKMRNPELGFRMLESAYEKGKKRAAFFLGKCYEEGIGTERSLLHALQCYKVAMEDNVWGAEEAYKRVRKLRREERKRSGI